MTTATEKSLRELAQEIAQALGPDWKLSTRFDAEDAQDRRPWRSRIEGPNNQALFLSNTWGPKGMLHVSGWAPDGVNMSTSGVGSCPSINVSLTKTGEQAAKDITRRLLPDYRVWLAKILDRDAQEKTFNKGKEQLQREVSALFGKEYHEGRELISSEGRIEVQVSGPDSMRLYGHCMYITLDQLKRFKAAVPELFERGEA